MDIHDAKQQVKDTVEAYLAQDEHGVARIAPDQQRPLFLLGAPGIGKTAIVGQVADELGIGLVAYSMTHHTRQSALGLPFIVHRTYRNGEEFDISEYTMSEIIASIYDFMEESGLDQGILFLDEINCVSETLYPSMLQFLQFKTFGRHRIPDGWIVVCAGNPQEYNRNVHEFDVVTLDRLRLIEIEPSFKAWRDYAREQRVHPAVMTYLDVRPEDFYLVESTPQSKQFVSARSWSELSGLMLLLESLGKPVDLRVFKQYLQHPEIAAKFAAYYDLFTKYRSDYQVEQILQGEVPDEIATRAKEAAFDERLALMSLLLDNLECSMGGLLEQLEALMQVRDVMRGAKTKYEGALAAGLDAAGSAGGAGVGGVGDFEFAAYLKDAADELENQVRRSSPRTGNLDKARIRACSAEVLRELCVLDTYEQAAEAYQAHVKELDGQAADVDSRLTCAYDFIDDVFGEGAEALVFTTELASRGCPAR